MNPIVSRFIRGENNFNDIILASPSFKNVIFDAIQAPVADPNISPPLLAGRLRSVFPETPIPAWLLPQAPSSPPRLKPADIFIAIGTNDYNLINILAETYPNEMKEILSVENDNPLSHALKDDSINEQMFEFLLEKFPGWIDLRNDMGDLPISLIPESTESLSWFFSLPVFSSKEKLIRYLTDPSLHPFYLQTFFSINHESLNPVKNVENWKFFAGLLTNLRNEETGEHKVYNIIRYLQHEWQNVSIKLFNLYIDPTGNLYNRCFDYHSYTFDTTQVPLEILQEMGITQWKNYHPEQSSGLHFIYCLSKHPDSSTTFPTLIQTALPYIYPREERFTVSTTHPLSFLETLTKHPALLELARVDTFEEGALDSFASELADNLLSNEMLSPVMSKFHYFPAETQAAVYKKICSIFSKIKKPNPFLPYLIKCMGFDVIYSPVENCFIRLFQTASKPDTEDQIEEVRSIINSIKSFSINFKIFDLLYKFHPHLKELPAEILADLTLPKNWNPDSKKINPHELGFLQKVTSLGIGISPNNFLKILMLSPGVNYIFQLLPALKNSNPQITEETSLEVISDEKIGSVVNNLMLATYSFTKTGNELETKRKVIFPFLQLVLMLLKRCNGCHKLNYDGQEIAACAFSLGFIKEGIELLELSNEYLDIEMDGLDESSLNALEAKYSQANKELIEYLNNAPFKSEDLYFKLNEKNALEIFISGSSIGSFYGTKSAIIDLVKRELFGLWFQKLEENYEPILIDNDDVVNISRFKELETPVLVKINVEKGVLSLYSINLHTGQLQIEVFEFENHFNSYEEIEKIIALPRRRIEQFRNDSNLAPITPKQLEDLPLDQYQVQVTSWGTLLVTYRHPETNRLFEHECYGQGSLEGFKASHKSYLQTINQIIQFATEHHIQFQKFEYDIMSYRLASINNLCSDNTLNILKAENHVFTFRKTSPNRFFGTLSSVNDLKESLSAINLLSPFFSHHQLSLPNIHQLPDIALDPLPSRVADVNLDELLRFFREGLEKHGLQEWLKKKNRRQETAESNISYFILASRGQAPIDGWSPETHRESFRRFQIMATHLIESYLKDSDPKPLLVFVQEVSSYGISCGKGLIDLVTQNYDIQNKNRIFQDPDNSLDAILSLLYQTSVNAFTSSLLTLSSNRAAEQQSVHIKAFINQCLFKINALKAISESDLNDGYAAHYGKLVFKTEDVELLWNSLIPIQIVRTFKDLIQSWVCEGKWDRIGTVMTALRSAIEMEGQKSSPSKWILNEEKEAYQKAYHDLSYKEDKVPKPPVSSGSKRSASDAEIESPAKKVSSPEVLMKNRFDLESIVDNIRDRNQMLETYQGIEIPSLIGLGFLLESKGILS